MKSDNYTAEEAQKLLPYVRRSATPPNMSLREAAEYLRAYGDEVHNALMLGTAYYQMGRLCYLDTGKMDRALPFLAMAIEQQKISHDYNLLSASYMMEGNIALSHRNYPLAVDYFNNAEKAAQQGTHPGWNKGKIRLRQARIYHEVRDYQDALKFINEAAILLRSHPENHEYYRCLTLAYSFAGHWYLEDGRNIRKADESAENLRNLIRGREDQQPLEAVHLHILEASIAFVRNDKALAEDTMQKLMPSLKKYCRRTSMIDDIQSLFVHLLDMHEYAWCAELVALIETFIDECSPTIRCELLNFEIRYYDAVSDSANRAAVLYRGFLAQQERETEANKTAIVAIQLERDQLKVQAENLELMRRAETDALTGMPNRYAMNKFSETAFERAWTNKEKLGIEMLDVDFFKQFNDLYGHQAGDICLECVAEVVRSLTDESPNISAFRYGGDEFVIFYQNMQDEEIIRCVSMIQERIRENHIPHGGSQISDIVTVSQGIYNAVPGNSHRHWDFLTGADGALYYVKKNRKGSYLLVHHVHPHSQN